MKIYIKNMVCQGTRKFVLFELKKLGLKLKSFESAEIEFQKDLSEEESAQLITSLRKYGLEMISLKNKLLRDVRYAFHKKELGNPVGSYLKEKIDEREIGDESYQHYSVQ